MDQEFCLIVVLAQALTHSHIHYPGVLIRKGSVIVSYFIAYNVTNNTQQTSGLFLINVGYRKQLKNILIVLRGTKLKTCTELARVLPLACISQGALFMIKHVNCRHELDRHAVLMSSPILLSMSACILTF